MLQKVENYRHALDQLEKSIISYSFIEFLSQTQKAAKPFCNDWRLLFGATGRT